MKHMRIVTAFAFATVFAASCGQQAQPPATERSPAGSATATSNSIRQSLNELGDLLIGRWRWEINLAVDYPGVGKKGEQVVGFETCRWIADRNAIECAFAYGKATETWFYWWDAGSKQIKSLGLDSGGNWYEGTISKQGDKLVWKVGGSFADGRPAQVQSETTFEDSGDTRVIVGATIVGGVRNEFRDVGKRVWK